ncbi:MAG: hypothetical protein U0528_03685 [Anaerolineae bacterium]
MRLLRVMIGCVVFFSLLSGTFVAAQRALDGEQCISVQETTNITAPRYGVIDAPSGKFFWQQNQPPNYFSYSSDYALLFQPTDSGYGGGASNTPFVIADLKIARLREKWTPDESTITTLRQGMRIDGGQVGMFQFGSTLLHISTDERNIAFAWIDQANQHFLTRLNIDSSEKLTVTLTDELSRELLEINSWSADNRYFLTNDTLDPITNTLNFRVWDVAALHPVAAPITLKAHAAAWSLTGSTLALLTDVNTLNLYDVARATTTTILLPENIVNQSLSWSPDGKYLAVSGFDSTKQNGFGAGYDVETFTILAASGAFLNPPVTGLYRKNISFEALTGRWSQDGQDWLFLRETDYAQDRLNAGIELAALEPASGNIRPIESRILTTWGKEVFLPESPIAGQFGLVVVTANDDATLNVDVLDGNGSNRVHLADHIEQILPQQMSSTPIMRLLANAETSLIAFTWLQQDRELLTWKNPDGTTKTVDLGLHNMAIRYWDDRSHLLYLAGTVEGKWQIAWVNTETGSSSVFIGVSQFELWNAVLQPDGDRLLITAMGRSGTQQLHLANTAGTLQKLINPLLTGSVLWSPDGSEFVYIVFDRGNLRLVHHDADGNFLRSDLTVPKSVNIRSDFRFLQTWTKCSSIIPNHD